MAFRKGMSGNPNGRPKGLHDKRTALGELLTPRAADLIDKALELAKDGDSSALRLCMARIVPPVRAKEEAVELGQVTRTLSEGGQAILDASLMGRSTPTQTATLMQVLMAQVRVAEADELAARAEALEQKVDRPKRHARPSMAVTRRISYSAIKRTML